MKRWGFKGLGASHGVSVSHRSLGSTGQRTVCVWCVCDRRTLGRRSRGRRCPVAWGTRTARSRTCSLACGAELSVGVQDRSEAESGVREGVCTGERRGVCEDHRRTRCGSLQTALPNVGARGGLEPRYIPTGDPSELEEVVAPAPAEDPYPWY